MSHGDSALALGEDRHGVVTLARARTRGLDWHDLYRLGDAGVLIREADGVWRVAGAPRTYEQRLALAIGAAGRAWVAGPAAARLWRKGVPWFEHAEPEVVIPYGRSLADAKRFAIVRRTRALDRRDTTTRYDLPITGLLRTVVDCVGRIPQDGFRALADDVLLRSHPGALRAAYDRTRRTRGRAWLEDALAPWETPGPPPDSPKEIGLLRVLLNAGLPLPQRQVPILDPATGRVVARADHAYPAARLAIEYLGERPHGLRQSHGDALRDEDLSALGWVAAYGRKEHLVPPGSGVYVALVVGLLEARCG